MPRADRRGTMNLEDKAGIVTGAGRGIGRSVALLMAREGASVIVNDPGAGRNGEVTTERPADEVVAEIAKAGGDALANYDSVADYASAGRMVRQCADTFGKIDFVVNAAGVLRALSGPPRGVLHPQKRGAKPTRKPDRAAGSRLCRSVPGAGHPC